MKTKDDSDSSQGEYVDNAVLSANDTRKPNLNNRQYPFNCLGVLRWKIGSGIFHGTAFLISSSFILTAAHNVKSVEGEEKHQDIKFYPQINSLWQKYDGEPVKVAKWKIVDEYKMNLKAQYDYAICLLEKEVPLQRYIMLAYGYPQIKEAMIHGYPYDLNKENHRDKNSYYLYGASGPVSRIQKGKVHHVIDTTYGQSGSPILCQLKKGVWYAVGIHNKQKHNKETKKAQINIGCFLNSQKMNIIKNWAKQFKKQIQIQLLINQQLKIQNELEEGDVLLDLEDFDFKKSGLTDKKANINYLSYIVK